MNYRVSHKYSGQWFEEALTAQNKIEIPFNSIRCTLQGAGHYSMQQFTWKKKKKSPPPKNWTGGTLSRSLLLLHTCSSGPLSASSQPHELPLLPTRTAVCCKGESLAKGSHCPLPRRLLASLPTMGPGDTVLHKVSCARLDVRGSLSLPRKTVRSGPQRQGINSPRPGQTGAPVSSQCMLTKFSPQPAHPSVLPSNALEPLTATPLPQEGWSNPRTQQLAPLRLAMPPSLRHPKLWPQGPISTLGFCSPF